MENHVSVTTPRHLAEHALPGEIISSSVVVGFHVLYMYMYMCNVNVCTCLCIGSCACTNGVTTILVFEKAAEECKLFVL